MKRKTTGADISKMLSISASRGVEAVIKAQLISAIIEVVDAKSITHAELAKRAELTRSTVTGILSGSLQKVTIDRILRLVQAVGLTAEVRLRKTS